MVFLTPEEWWQQSKSMAQKMCMQYRGLNTTVRTFVPPTIQPPQVANNGTIRLTLQDANGGLPYNLSLVPAGNTVQVQVLSQAPPQYSRATRLHELRPP